MLLLLSKKIQVFTQCSQDPIPPNVSLVDGLTEEVSGGMEVGVLGENH